MQARVVCSNESIYHSMETHKGLVENAMSGRCKFLACTGGLYPGECNKLSVLLLISRYRGL